MSRYRWTCHWNLLGRCEPLPSSALESVKPANALPDEVLNHPKEPSSVWVRWWWESLDGMGDYAEGSCPSEDIRPMIEQVL